MIPYYNMFTTFAFLDPETNRFSYKDTTGTHPLSASRAVTSLAIKDEDDRYNSIEPPAWTIGQVIALQKIFSLPNQIRQFHIGRYKLTDKEIIEAFKKVNTTGVRDLTLNSKTDFELLFSAPNFENLDQLIIVGIPLDSVSIRKLTNVGLKNLTLFCELLKSSSAGLPHLFSHTSLETLSCKSKVDPKDRHVDQIMKQFSENSALTTLSLNEVSQCFYEGLLKGLLTNTTLTSLSCAPGSSKSELNVEDFSDIIACNTTLQSLTLVHSSLQISFPTLIKFTTESDLEVMCLRRINRSVYLNNTPATPIDFNPDKLNVPNLISLNVCSLRGIKFSSNAARMFLSLVSASPHLSELTFTDCLDPSISHEVFPEIVEIVEKNTCLTFLNVSYNFFSEPFNSKNLTSTLPNNSTLKTLMISDLSFEAPAGRQPDPHPFLESVFTVNTTLEKLYLGGYPELETQRIASYLKNNSTMLNLSFDTLSCRELQLDVLERNRWNLKQKNILLLNIFIKMAY